MTRSGYCLILLLLVGMLLAGPVCAQGLTMRFDTWPPCRVFWREATTVHFVGTSDRVRLPRRPSSAGAPLAFEMWAFAPSPGAVDANRLEALWKERANSLTALYGVLDARDVEFIAPATLLASEGRFPRQGRHTLKFRYPTVGPALAWFWYRPWISAAACLAVLSGSVYAVRRRRRLAERQADAARLREWLKAGGDDPLCGRFIGPYRLVECLGRGGMSVVYRAHKDGPLAVKILSPEICSDATSMSRFRKEVLAMSRLNHPALVRLLDWGQEGPISYLVLELAPGKRLDDQIPHGGMPLKQAWPVIRQILSGLQHAHGLGIIHRDIKPGNILLSDAGRVTIIDFGIAQRVADQASAKIMGTPGYVAPEQARGEQADARTVEFGVGIVAWQLLTGQVPWVPGAHPPESRELADILRKMMSPQPADRYPSLHEAQAALEDLTRRLTL